MACKVISISYYLFSGKFSLALAEVEFTNLTLYRIRAANISKFIRLIKPFPSLVSHDTFILERCRL